MYEHAGVVGTWTHDRILAQSHLYCSKFQMYCIVVTFTITDQIDVVATVLNFIWVVPGLNLGEDNGDSDYSD
jgi:hypothetical protein